tara:strand:+ start:142 stop:816 length:675 start_codon:yes stop_codon:yes gene_type:complete
MLGLGNSLTGGIVTEEAAWAPSDVSSLVHWYKYDTGITQDGDGDITAWADQKGSNNLTASGATSTSPEYDGGAIKFTDSGDDLEWGSEISLGAFSFYFRYESSDVAVDWLIKGGSTDWVKVHSDSNIRVKIGTRMDFDTSGMSADTKVNLGITRASNGDVDVLINNSAQSSASGYTDNVAISTTYDITRIGSPLVTIKMYEVLVFNDVLSTEDRGLLNTYLNTI